MPTPDAPIPFDQLPLKVRLDIIDREEGDGETTPTSPTHQLHSNYFDRPLTLADLGLRRVNINAE